tara:strand:- start:79 stop:1311 length:1233 start_codon:yes stop_codon:yes gene_type:complete
MNDGSALTGTMTFTNGNAAVSGSGTNFDPEVKVGDIIISAGGVKSRVKAVTSDTALTLVENFSGSTENGVAATVTRPPINFASSGSQIDDTIFGITAAESTSGIDNVTTIAVATGGTGYKGSAPTITIPVPTVRTIATAKVSTANETIEITGHNMQTGTAVKYQDGGGTALAGLVDNTQYFVIRHTADLIKLASSLSNANAGTAINLTGTGNNAQTLEGIQATATATISGGRVATVTVTNVGSDYQSTPAVTVAAPAEQTFNAQSAVSTANDTITISGHLLQTGDQVTYSDKGGTTLANLTDAGAHFVIRVNANTIKLATTAANAADGVAIDLTAGSSENHGLTGVTATVTASRGLGNEATDNKREGYHVGWVKRTVGTGGRAGRVQYETLVAASSITGDAEDIVTPENA